MSQSMPHRPVATREMESDATNVVVPPKNLQSSQSLTRPIQSTHKEVQQARDRGDRLREVVLMMMKERDFYYNLCRSEVTRLTEELTDLETTVDNMSLQFPYLPTLSSFQTQSCVEETVVSQSDVIAMSSTTRSAPNTECSPMGDVTHDMITCDEALSGSPSVSLHLSPSPSPPPSLPPLASHISSYPHSSFPTPSTPASIISLLFTPIEPPLFTVIFGIVIRTTPAIPLITLTDTPLARALLGTTLSPSSIENNKEISNSDDSVVVYSSSPSPSLGPRDREEKREKCCYQCGETLRIGSQPLTPRGLTSHPLVTPPWQTSSPVPAFSSLPSPLSTTIPALVTSRWCCFHCRDDYCQGCHVGTLFRLPVQMVAFGDYSTYTVCVQARTRLSSFHHVPVLDIAQVDLHYAIRSGMMTMFQLRRRLMLIKNVIYTCTHRTHLLSRLSTRHYMMDSVSLVSIVDLIDLKEGRLIPFLASLVHSYVDHVTSACYSCVTKGRHCAVCGHPPVVFAFDVERVKACDACHQLCHTVCLHTAMLDLLTDSLTEPLTEPSHELSFSGPAPRHMCHTCWRRWEIVSNERNVDTSVAT